MVPIKLRVAPPSARAAPATPWRKGATNYLLISRLIQTDGTEITKRFTFNRGDYLVKVDYLVDNQSDNRWSGSFYAQLKRDSSADPAADTTGMGMKPFLGVATMTMDKPYVKIAFDDLKEKPLNAHA